MELVDRFRRAQTIAEPMLKGGNYRWLPTTQLGWVLRISCSDVGVDAWQKAGVNPGDGEGEQPVLPMVITRPEISGTGSEPASNLPAPEPNPSEQQ